MKITKIFTSAALVFATAFIQAEVKTFDSNNIHSFSNFVYPDLILDNIDQINIRLDEQVTQNNPMPIIDFKRVEFKFANANNLVASNFTQLINIPDTYRAIVTSPWVFKKVMVELKGNEFSDHGHFSYQVFVVENSSSLNDIELVQGLALFGGDAELINTTPNKVVDVVRTKYLDKPLTLRLLDQASIDGIKIEAIWMGHGTKILTLPFPIYPEQKPVALIVDTVFDDKRIKVRLNDAYYGPETPDESLRLLLEQAFGSLPSPEAPLP